MDALNDYLLFLDGYLGSSIWFVALLLFTGLFFTLYLGFPQIRYFRHATKVVTGKFDKEGAAGDTTHFQALTTALSGTVGTGNIGGVALALYLGGPAALFWMWMTAFLGMTTKFVEVTLSHKYREITADGTMAGGPMYFMEKRLNAKWLAIIFAVATVFSSFGTGNFPQVNNIAVGLESSFSIDRWVTGAVLSVLLALVIVGGIKRIAAIAAKLVPTMALIYIVGAFAVIIPNYGNILPSFAAIFSDVFTGSAALGGFMGAGFAFAILTGVNRGLFSNEAGQGSAPIAHASARTDEPVDEGMVSLLEPFIDTIIICTITGLVILSSGVWNEKHQNTFARADIDIVSGIHTDQVNSDRTALLDYLNNGDNSEVSSYTGVINLVEGQIQNTEDFTLLHARSLAEDMVFSRDGQNLSETVQVSNGRLDDLSINIDGKSLIHSVPLTSVAFKQGLFGESGQYIVTIGLLLFAFSTAIAWSYYGDRAITYLFGPKAVMPYRVVYVGGFFMAAQIDTTIVWTISAITIFAMTLPNLIGILLLRREMKDTVQDYLNRTDISQ